MLAGYLYISDTVQLKVIIEHNEIIKAYINKQKKAFRIPDRKPDGTWSQANIFRFVATADHKLQSVTLSLKTKDKHKNVKPGHVSIGNASWAVIIM